MTTTRRTTISLVVIAAGVVAAGLGLATCSGDGEEGAPGSSPTTGGAGSELQREAQEVTDSLLGAGPEAPPVASAQGSVDTLSGMKPAVAEVVAVEVGASSTLLRWRLRSTGETLVLKAATFSSFEQPSRSATEVALVDPAAKELARPFRTRGTSFGISCVCSIVPNEVDQSGQELTGLYPLFSGDTSQVEVRIPGFPPMTGVPVTHV